MEVAVERSLTGDFRGYVLGSRGVCGDDRAVSLAHANRSELDALVVSSEGERKNAELADGRSGLQVERDLESPGPGAVRVVAAKRGAVFDDKRLIAVVRRWRCRLRREAGG